MMQPTEPRFSCVFSDRADLDQMVLKLRIQYQKYGYGEPPLQRVKTGVRACVYKVVVLRGSLLERGFPPDLCGYIWCNFVARSIAVTKSARRFLVPAVYRLLGLE